MLYASPLPYDIISDDEANETLKSLLSLNNSNSQEIQLESVKIICDLSYQDSHHELLSRNGWIPVLVTNLTSKCNCIKRNCMLSLSNLSESQSCQVRLIHNFIIECNLV